MYPYKSDTVPGTQMDVCGIIGGILIVSLSFILSYIPGCP